MCKTKNACLHTVLNLVHAVGFAGKGEPVSQHPGAQMDRGSNVHFLERLVQFVFVFICHSCLFDN